MENNELLQKIEILEKKMADMESSRGLRAFLSRAFSKSSFIIGIAVAAALTGFLAWAAQNTFVDGTVISADAVNANFTELYNSVANLDSKTSLSDLSCVSGQIPKWNGTEWTCASATPEHVPGDLEYNEFVTTVVGVSDSYYNGKIIYTSTSNGRKYYGRAATTAICQDKFGVGARMCGIDDLTRMMQSNSIIPSDDGTNAYSPAGAFSLPTVQAWINTNSRGSDINIYGDCFNWSGASAGGSYSSFYYEPPNSTFPYGYFQGANCNVSYRIMCCK